MVLKSQFIWLNRSHTFKLTINWRKSSRNQSFYLFKKRSIHQIRPTLYTARMSWKITTSSVTMEWYPENPWTDVKYDMSTINFCIDHHIFISYNILHEKSNKFHDFFWLNEFHITFNNQSPNTSPNACLPGPN